MSADHKYIRLDQFQRLLDLIGTRDNHGYWTYEKDDANAKVSNTVAFLERNASNGLPVRDLAMAQDYVAHYKPVMKDIEKRANEALNALSPFTNIYSLYDSNTSSPHAQIVTVLIYQQEIIKSLVNLINNDDGEYHYHPDFISASKRRMLNWHKGVNYK
ncbi:hypothetical protein [Phage f2b1]|nr:hypothetical protein [Phage f2b1]